VNTNLCNIFSDDIDRLRRGEWLGNPWNTRYKRKALSASGTYWLSSSNMCINATAAAFSANTPYINTIHVQDQACVPSSREMERRIKKHHPLERDGDGHAAPIWRIQE